MHVAGAAAESAADAKIRKYADLPRAVTFVPIAVETLGPICSDGIEFITELGRRIASVSGDPRDTAFFVSTNFHRGSEGQRCKCVGSSEAGLRLRLKYRSSRRY